MKTKYLAFVIVISVALAYLIFYSYQKVEPKISVNNFEECQAAGYPIMESYPEQCRTPEGQLFVRVIPEVTPTPPIEQSGVSFGNQYILKIGKGITFSDGLSVTLKEINDSRCPKGAQCIWAGELAPLLSITGGAFGITGKEIRLGTVQNKSVNVDGYTFILHDASEKSATLIVSKGAR